MRVFAHVLERNETIDLSRLTCTTSSHYRVVAVCIYVSHSEAADHFDLIEGGGERIRETAENPVCCNRKLRRAFLGISPRRISDR